MISPSSTNHLSAGEVVVLREYSGCLITGEKEINLDVALCWKGWASCARLGFKKNDNLVKYSAKTLCNLVAAALHGPRRTLLPKNGRGYSSRSDQLLKDTINKYQIISLMHVSLQASENMNV